MKAKYIRGIFAILYMIIVKLLQQSARLVCSTNSLSSRETKERLSDEAKQLHLKLLTHINN